MKARVIFCHIIKCGGTSLRHMLLDEYGYDAIAPVPVNNPGANLPYPTVTGINPLVYMATVTPELVKDYPLVMSHYDIRIARQLPEHHIITMLRHPVNQLFSLFKFTNRNLITSNQEEMNRRFRDWLTPENVAQFSNVQTRYLSSHGNENKEIALSWLMNGRLTFGILERFDDSLRLFNESFDWSLKAKHMNRTPKSSNLDAETIALVEKLQADDMELYRIACDLFESQFKEQL